METSVPTSPVILNLGCGDKLLEGFVNVDIPGGNWSGKKPDVECDLRKLDFPDDYADGAMAIHVIEHFQRWEVLDLLREWRRVLKPGAQLIIECPCLDKVIKLFAVPEIGGEMTIGALYGNPAHKTDAMMHKWCYSRKELGNLLTKAGFSPVAAERPQFHFPNRDQRFVATKPTEGRVIVGA